MTETVTIGATIPCQEYGNLQPTITVEGETRAEALETGLREIKAIWDRVGRKPLEIDKAEEKPAVESKVETKYCWASGAKVFFDPVAHTYTDAEGARYMGGSSFAGRYTQEFPADPISSKMATKHSVGQQDILDMWRLNAHASATIGTAIHAALELRGRYGELSQKVKQGSFESALSSNPVLRPIVEAFFTEERSAVKAEYEILVADPKRHHAGLIDRLEIYPDGVKVTDFKSNQSVIKAEKILSPFTDLVPATKLGSYQLQLSYYSRILKVHGVNVLGLMIYHWDGKEWIEYPMDVIDLDAAFKDKAS